MIALLYFLIIYLYTVFFWIYLTRNPEFFNMMIPGFIAIGITNYLIVNQYLPINLT